MDIYSALERFKREPETTGIFSDLDGTLSAIAETPESASLTADARGTLMALNAKFRVVCIVSGRDSDDARRMVGLEELLYIGSHGLEWIDDAGHHYTPEAIRFLGQIARLADELNILFKNTDIRVEKKKLGVAMHYRLAEDKDAAEALIGPAVEEIIAKYPMRAISGRFVVELKPDLEINKGESIAAICLQRGLKNALYLGDDVTDVDAFRTLRRLRDEKGMKTVSVAVLSSEAADEVAKEADHTLNDIGAVVSLLEWLADVMRLGYNRR